MWSVSNMCEICTTHPTNLQALVARTSLFLNYSRYQSQCTKHYIYIYIYTHTYNGLDYISYNCSRSRSRKQYCLQNHASRAMSHRFPHKFTRGFGGTVVVLERPVNLSGTLWRFSAAVAFMKKLCCHIISIVSRLLYSYLSLLFW